jgi:NAD(P)-dependent dehydrogenase (short-subunit alcohol dehydrogenase family)
MGRLSERVAFVTGGGQGIGRGVALALGSEGARVAAVDLRGDNAERTAADIVGRQGEAIAVICDVRDRAAVDASVASVVERFGGIDILVNAALGPLTVVPFEQTTLASMEELWRSGLLGTAFTMQACLPHLRRSGRGRVINFGSGAGINGAPGYAAYAPVKEGVRALTRVASREWGHDGITVNAICPYANSPGWKQWGERNPEFVAQANASTSVGRVGDCELDIGRAAVWLAGDDAAFVTGHTLMVDGGQSHL